MIETLADEARPVGRIGGESQETGWKAELRDDLERALVAGAGDGRGRSRRSGGSTSPAS
jgi:hypothetical protein